MTTEDLDALRRIVHEVLEERRGADMNHAAVRDRVTRFTRSDGVTLTSVTQTHRDWIKTIAAVVGAISIIVGAFNVVVVYPIIDRRAQAQIKVHADEAQAKMNEIAKQIVFRSEWDRWTAEKDERWRNMDLNIAEIKAALIKLQDNQVEILRRIK